jgi:hypothetical protein
MPRPTNQETTAYRAIPRPRPPNAGEHQESADPSTTAPQTAPPGRPSRLVRYLTDPSIQAAIDAFVATAPPLTEDQRARLSRLLRTDRCHRRDEAA